MNPRQTASEPPAHEVQHGLSRGHHPKTGSWNAEAGDLLRELRDIIDPPKPPNTERTLAEIADLVAEIGRAPGLMNGKLFRARR